MPADWCCTWWWPLDCASWARERQLAAASAGKPSSSASWRWSAKMGSCTHSPVNAQQPQTEQGEQRTTVSPCRPNLAALRHAEYCLPMQGFARSQRQQLIYLGGQRALRDGQALLPLELASAVLVPYWSPLRQQPCCISQLLDTTVLDACLTMVPGIAGEAVGPLRLPSLGWTSRSNLGLACYYHWQSMSSADLKAGSP